MFFFYIDNMKKWQKILFMIKKTLSLIPEDIKIVITKRKRVNSKSPSNHNKSRIINKRLDIVSFVCEDTSASFQPKFGNSFENNFQNIEHQRLSCYEVVVPAVQEEFTDPAEMIASGGRVFFLWNTSTRRGAHSSFCSLCPSL